MTAREELERLDELSRTRALTEIESLRLEALLRGTGQLRKRHNPRRG